MTPNWVAKILESDALWHVSRLLITFMYWYAGLGFLFDFTGAQATMGAFGFHPVWLVAALTLGTQLIGSALIIADRYVWFGAGMLGVFTLLTIPLTHDFWNMTGIEAIQAKLESEEHLTVVGGLIIVSILSQVRRQWRQSRG